MTKLAPTTLAGRYVPANDEFEGRGESEAPPRPRHYAEIGVVARTQVARRAARKWHNVRRPSRGGLDLLRPPAQEHAEI